MRAAVTTGHRPECGTGKPEPGCDLGENRRGCWLLVSITEIAKRAGVSQSTASIVLNGKGNQYRISAATQQRILEVAKELGYQPNISARRLRSGGEIVLPIIALMWTQGTRARLIGRFLDGIQQGLQELGEEYELLIVPFKENELHQVRSLLTGTRYNGAIIANTTEDDDAFLEKSELNVPIVLYQRQSKKYATVRVDSFKSGQMVADRFAERGHKKLGLVMPALSSQAVRLRMEGFLSRAAELGLEIGERHIVYEDYSEKGGYNAAKALFADKDAPTAIFATSDQMAVGILHALHELGVDVPGRVELIGHDNETVTRFTTPRLSTVHLPVEEMGRECVKLLTDMMKHKTEQKIDKLFDTYIVTRDTCG